MHKVCGHCGGAVDASVYEEPDVGGFDLYMWCCECMCELSEEDLVDGEPL